MCAAGSLANLMGTTCDIGSLEFTFTGFLGDNYAIDTIGASQTLLYDTPYSPGDFTFTPVAGGFTLTLNQGAQTITAPVVTQGTSQAFDDAALQFTATDLDGNFVGTAVAGTISDTGNSNLNDSAGIFGSLVNYPGDGVSYYLEQINGIPLAGTENVGPPFASGTGAFEPFALQAETGTAYWAGSSTITFDTVDADATPEPTSLALLASSLAFLAAGLRRHRGQP